MGRIGQGRGRTERRASTSEAELLEWCRERLARYKCPKSIEIMDALPRNPTGKLLKKDLRKPYWENQDRAI